MKRLQDFIDAKMIIIIFARTIRQLAALDRSVGDCLVHCGADRIEFHSGVRVVHRLHTAYGTPYLRNFVLMNARTIYAERGK